jgi:dTDP-4-amino-4,6-dideoxy-D-galactose acyltransferase
MSDPALLARSICFPALDFVPGISIDALRAAQAAHLLRALPVEHDLRLEVGPDLFAAAEILPWDSALFGTRIARLHGIRWLSPPFDRPDADLRDAVEAVVAVARKKGVRYLFTVVDHRETAVLRALGGARFCIIESRATYHRAMQGFVPEGRWPVRLATSADRESLSATARECRNPYDRFHSDPFFTAEQADQMMTRWVEASLEGFADEVVVPDVPAPEAFCTVKYHREEWARFGVRLAQPVVLGAVARPFRGWYRRLISEILCRMQEQGVEHGYLTTQTSNRAAIAVFERLGFRHGAGEHVLRLVLD